MYYEKKYIISRINIFKEELIKKALHPKDY